MLFLEASDCNWWVPIGRNDLSTIGIKWRKRITKLEIYPPAYCLLNRLSSVIYVLCPTHNWCKTKRMYWPFPAKMPNSVQLFYRIRLVQCGNLYLHKLTHFHGYSTRIANLCSSKYIWKSVNSRRRQWLNERVDFSVQKLVEWKQICSVLFAQMWC